MYLFQFTFGKYISMFVGIMGRVLYDVVIRRGVDRGGDGGSVCFLCICVCLWGGIRRRGM